MDDYQDDNLLILINARQYDITWIITLHIDTGIISTGYMAKINILSFHIRTVNFIYIYINLQWSYSHMSSRLFKHTKNDICIADQHQGMCENSLKQERWQVPFRTNPTTRKNKSSIIQILASLISNVIISHLLRFAIFRFQSMFRWVGFFLDLFALRFNFLSSVDYSNIMCCRFECTGAELCLKFLSH